MKPHDLRAADSSGVVYGKRIPRFEVRRLSLSPAPIGVANMSSAAATLLRPHFDGLAQEAFIVAHLDTRHRLTGWEEVARGSMNAVNVSPAEIFRGALIRGAAAIIIAHNHPSGDPTASADDNTLTDRIEAAGRLLGVPVLDHLIFGDSEFYAYADKARHGY